MSGSKMKAFSSDDPIRLLAHNLDFWVHTVTAMSPHLCWSADALQLMCPSTAGGDAGSTCPDGLIRSLSDHRS